MAWFFICFLLRSYFYSKFYILDRNDVLDLITLSEETPDAKQELLKRLLSGNILKIKDKKDIKNIVDTEQEKKNHIKVQNDDRRKIEAFLKK
ncbi:hypothetical protein BvCmsNSNP012_05005 [Escherichia coli]|nr:hypothetical protein BvCmsNSNP012_05005 [Escherichia coli]